MSEFRATPSCPWPLLSKKDVEEASPSQKEGMAYQKEMSFMRSMCELMKRTGAKLKLTRAVATAIVFAHRYYAIKSMQKNERFIVSCACLFLAGKVEDEPRALQDVATVCFRQRYNNNPEVLKTAREPHIVATLREAILTAERALLYALGFQFSIDHPQVFIRDTLDRFSAMPDPVGKFWTEFKGKAATIALMQNFINDLYKGTKLVLRYDLRLLGATAIHLGLATLKAPLPAWNHDIVPMIDGRPWYEVAMMKSHPFGDSEASPVSATKELLEEIGREILNLYVTRSQEGAKEVPEADGPVLAEGAKEALEADGPVTPPLDHFQATTPAASRMAEDSIAAAVLGPPGLSPEQDGQLPAGTPAAAQAGSSAENGAGLTSSLRPDAAEFHPSAEKAAAGSGAPAPARGSPQPGHGATSAGANHGGERKRSSEAAGLHSQPEQSRSPKSPRGMPANGDASTSGRSPGELRHVHVPNGAPAAVPNGLAAGSLENGSAGNASSLAKHAAVPSTSQAADLAEQGPAHAEGVSI